MPRDGTKNLIPYDKLTEKEQKELVRKGGEASGKTRKKKKKVKEVIEAILSSNAPKKYVDTLHKHFPEVDIQTLEELCNLTMIKEIMKGNVQAYNAIYDRKEGKPKQAIGMDANVNSTERLSDKQMAELKATLATQGLITEEEKNELDGNNKQSEVKD
jgi:hypothetical protein